MRALEIIKGYVIYLPGLLSQNPTENHLSVVMLNNNPV